MFLLLDISRGISITAPSDRNGANRRSCQDGRQESIRFVELSSDGIFQSIQVAFIILLSPFEND